MVWMVLPDGAAGYVVFKFQIMIVVLSQNSFKIC